MSFEGGHIQTANLPEEWHRQLLTDLRVCLPDARDGGQTVMLSQTPPVFVEIVASVITWKTVFGISALAFLTGYWKKLGEKTAEETVEKTPETIDRFLRPIRRLAVLWPRTVDAIRQYQSEHPHHSEFLFASEIGQPYNGNHMGRNFRRRRTEAKLPVTVEFAHIRDGAETAAIEGGADLTAAKLLAGHRTGISDHYVRRNPKMVADACEAIERHYFK